VKRPLYFFFDLAAAGFVAVNAISTWLLLTTFTREGPLPAKLQITEARFS
jgi:hypothetical protein